MHYTGFLSRDQRAAAIRQIDEDRRRTKIEIRSFRLRAVLLICGVCAGDIVGVTFRHLTRPQNLPGSEVECQDSVGGASRRIGITVSRGYVERALLDVNGWRAPHAAAGRPV